MQLNTLYLFVVVKSYCMCFEKLQKNIYYYLYYLYNKLLFELKNILINKIAYTCKTTYHYILNYPNEKTTTHKQYKALARYATSVMLKTRYSGKINLMSSFKYN